MFMSQELVSHIRLNVMVLFMSYRPTWAGRYRSTSFTVSYLELGVRLHCHVVVFDPCVCAVCDVVHKIHVGLETGGSLVYQTSHMAAGMFKVRDKCRCSASPRRSGW